MASQSQGFGINFIGCSTGYVSMSQQFASLSRRPGMSIMFSSRVNRALFATLLIFGIFFSAPGLQPVHAVNGVGIKDFLYTGATAPTGQKPQSKLWHNDGLWWGVLFNKTSGKFEIYRLNWATQTWSTTGTAVDSRAKSSADALWDGSKLYTVSAVPVGTTGDVGIKLMRYSYNSSTQTYSVDSNFPVVLASSAIETVVMDKDSSGMLWVTYTNTNTSGGRKVLVTHSLGNDTTWVTPYVIQATGASNLSIDDISTIVAYNGKIGVMWSNQNDNTVYFASHVDGTGDNLWILNPALQGPKYADDHMNIKSLQADSSGQVYAAVKTSLNDVLPSTSSEPLILLLELDNNGSWSRRTVARVSDNHTRPIVLLDVENRQVYVFMTYQYGTQTSGAIYYKTSSLDNKGVQFPEGVGMPFIEFSTDTHINNISSTKQPLNGTTNLVAIAGDDTSRYYFHNFIDLPNSGPMATPTNTTLPTNTPTPTDTSVPPTPTPMGDPLFADDFESGDFSKWTTVVNAVNGFAIVQSSSTYAGTYAAEFTSQATKNSLTYIRKNLETAQADLTLSGYFNVTMEGSKTANTPYFRLFNPSGTRVVSLYRQNSSGLVRATDQSVTRDTTAKVPLDTWAKVDLHIVAAGSGLSTIQVSINNVQVLKTTTANIGTAGILNVQLGNETTTQLYTLTADNIVVAGPGVSSTSTPTFTYTLEPPTATPLPSDTPTATLVATNLFDDGFESGSFSAWTSVTTGGDGSASVQGATFNSGTFAALLSETANTGSVAYLRKSLPAPELDLTVSGYFIITQEGVSGGNVPLIRLYSSSGTRLVTLYRQNLDSDRVWLSDGVTRFSTTGLIPLNTWVKVDLRAVTGGIGASGIQLYINDALVFNTATASLGTSGVLTAQIGNETSKQTFTLFADDVTIKK
jgi:hypothetical protein